MDKDLKEIREGIAGSRNCKGSLPFLGSQSGRREGARGGLAEDEFRGVVGVTWANGLSSQPF